MAPIPAEWKDAMQDRPAPRIYRLEDRDLDRDLPPEYRGAALVASLAEVLRQRPVSVLLVGGPGTGKTRQGWAMLRADRMQRWQSLMAEGEAIQAVKTAQGWVWPISRDAWADKAVGQDRVRIVSECSDLRRNEWDHEWLDRQTLWPRWLVLDDVGAVTPSRWSMEAIYHLANQRRAWRRPTLWTTNLDAEGMRRVLGEAVASRLYGGAVVVLTGPDRRLLG